MSDYHYVYILQSEVMPARHYTGLTNDLKARLAKHNRGEVPHTSKYAPWNLRCAIAFADRAKAATFEAYLKSHSGRVFASRHF